jgi:hypothetical protein
MSTSKFRLTRSKRTVFRLKYFLTFAVLTIVGLLILIISLLVAAKYQFLSLFLNQVSTALLVSALLSGIYELSLRLEFLRLNDENTKEFKDISKKKYDKLIEETSTLRDELKVLKQEFEKVSKRSTEQLLEKLDLKKQIGDIGLEEVSLNANSYDYSSLILHSRDLVVVLNDGRTWVSERSDLFQQRFKDSEKTTTFFLTHPNSTLLPILAQREATSEDSIKKKISDTLSRLNLDKCDDTNLKVYGHYFYNPFSLFLGDDVAIITPYFYSRVKRALPVFKFRDNNEAHCYYQLVKLDIESLILDAEDISQFSFNL